MVDEGTDNEVAGVNKVGKWIGGTVLILIAGAIATAYFIATILWIMR